MGWGRIGQHRKSGSRGGFGAAGLHKHKWTLLKAKKVQYFGKRGFKKPLEILEEKLEINVGELDEKIGELLTLGYAREEGGMVHVDLEALGLNKLLGRGRVTKKLMVKVRYATKSAIEKIESIGGKVQVLSVVEKS